MFGKTRRPAIAIERLDVADLHFADQLPEGRLVELPGRGSAFVRLAKGPEGAPTVLLLHGLMATADLNWSLAVPALARRFHVVAPDLRGHGRGLRTRRFNADECADDLAALVHTLEAGRVIVVGYSLGGLVAQVFVRRHPELVAGLVLCATAGRFDVPTGKGAGRVLEQAARRLPESARRAVMLALLAPKSANSERGRWLMSEVRRHDTRALLDAAAEAAAFDSRSWLGDTTCGAAVIVTHDDKVVSPEAQRDLARVLGRGLVFEIEGDHFVCIKRPDDFNEVLVAACEGAHAS
ncbi:MAG TPA: alpha/beta hydrolase [Candidatus Dormibacteraeota bacterium]|nr:alpha/beta hydrolase [Candidatus Dormibacteraeota bacterium]